MRELVLNEVGLWARFASPRDALLATCDVAEGLIELRAERVASNGIRLHAQLHEIVLSTDYSFGDAIADLIKDKATRDIGIFLGRLATLTPIDRALEESLIDALLNHSVAEYGDNHSLMICALSRRILVSISVDKKWLADIISVIVLSGAETSTKNIENLASKASAEPIIERYRDYEASIMSVTEFWARKADLFPRLEFGLDVAAQLKSLGTDSFRSAVSRLRDMDTTVREWRRTGDITPRYGFKVTSESESTMNQFGNFRVFRDHRGVSNEFRLHARIQDGFRVHFVEDAIRKNLVIGYIGHHLPTKKFPD